MGSSSKTDYNTPAAAMAAPTNAPVAPEGGSPVQNPWVNFLDPGMGMSTGFTPRMEQQMAAMYAPTSPPQRAGSSAPQMAIPKLALHGNIAGMVNPQTATMAQGIVDRANKGNSLESYLQGREQLAQIMQRGADMRYGGGSGRGANYGSSGR